jgi:phosphoribosylformylglycinamidine synthase
MGQLVATIRGMAAACTALGTPITGGNVSLYNATGDADIHPTPVVGVLGVLDDVSAAVGSALVGAGDALLLVGAPTRPGLAGSAWQQATGGRLEGRPARIDLDEERALQELLVTAAADGLLRSAHDVADGGLLATLVESALPRMLGARVRLEDGVAPLQALCSESPSRVVVSARASEARLLTELCAERRVPVHELGTVVGEPIVAIEAVGLLDLDDLLVLHETRLTSALGLAPSPR